MFLYKIEIELKEQTVFLIVLADTDEKAFDAVEENVVKYFITNPEIVEMGIVEKKRVNPGAGFLIETKG